MRPEFSYFLVLVFLFSSTAYGKRPTDIQAIQNAVAKTLRDPYSAHWRTVASKKEPDGSTLVCGMVSAKNGFGAYAGEHPFVGRAGGKWPKPSGNSIPQLPADDSFCQKFIHGP